MVGVALVTAYNDQGELLLGRRRDSRKWTIPGGHLEEGEDPAAGAARELREETGLEATSLSFLREHVTKTGLKLYCFSAYVHGKPHSKLDPDNEVEEWKFVDVTEGLPSRFYNNLQGPDPESGDNLVTNIFDIKKAEDASPRADDEISRMLKHPDPIERRMALRFNGVRPDHVQSAALDSDPLVHEAAVVHPAFGDVEGINLMRATKDAAGTHPLQQKLAFLRLSDRVQPVHFTALVQHAHASADPFIRTALVDAAVKHPLLDPENLRSIYRAIDSTHSQRLGSVQHPHAPEDVLQHALGAGLVSPSPETTERARAAVAHHGLTPATREAFVRQVSSASPEHVRQLAEHALANGATSRELWRHLFIQHALKRSPEHDSLLGAFLRGPTAAREDVDEAFSTGNHAVMLGASGSKALSPQHMDQLVASARAAGDHEAIKRLMDHPFFGNRHLKMLVSEPVQKAESHDPGDVRQMDPIEAGAWVFRMKNAFSNAPWALSAPDWGQIHQGLVGADPEMYQHVRETMHPQARITRAQAQQHAQKEADEKAAYEAQAVEIGDHVHLPDHQQRKVAGGKDAWLYYGTTSKHLPKILREGITGEQGVGLSARRAPGPGTADGDSARAVAVHGGTPVVVRIKHPFDALQLDAGLGNHRFRVAHVPAENVMEVDGERVKRPSLSKSENQNVFSQMSNHPVVRAMFGFDFSLDDRFRAAKFLAAGADVPHETMRQALYQSDNDMEAAALRSHGFEVNEENRQALRSVMGLSALTKSEMGPCVAESVVAPHPEGADVAEAVRRAYEDSFVFEVSLGGKHSQGSMLAHDKQTDITWLLKSGSGGAGPAAGAAQDASNPNAREAAWYHIAEAWGIHDCYPRAELLLIDGKRFAAMKLLPWSYRGLDKLREQDPGVVKRVLAPYLNDGRLHEWAIMDYVLGNPDSHGQNVMSEDRTLQRPNERSTHGVRHNIVQDIGPEKVALIDHGSAFAGPAFDPAHDQNSFVPYYLRAWGTRDAFNQLAPEEKLKILPRVSPVVATTLKTWLDGLSDSALLTICESYGIDPNPSLARLVRLRASCEMMPVDLAVNHLWVTT